MYITDDGTDLYFDISAYEGDKTGPFVMVIHGFTGHCEEPFLQQIRSAFHEAGADVMIAELYGHGRSGGAFRNHTLYRWFSNLIRLIDEAKEHWMKPGQKLILCGHSQGGLSVLMAAAMKKDVVNGVIALAPALNIPEDARSGTLLGYAFNPDHIPDELPANETDILSGNYIRVAQTIFPEPVIRTYLGPVLVIHGTADESVPYQVSEQAMDYLSNGMLELIDGDTHCFDRYPDNVCQTAVRWLNMVCGMEETE